MSLLAALLLSLAVAAGSAWIAGATVRGSLGTCLVGQLGAMLLRFAGLAGIILLLHLRWPAELLLGLSIAAVVVLGGLALDARRLLRTVRAPNEERVRA